MSQQDLYLVLGLHGYRVTNVERDEKQLFVHARPQPHRVCCSACGCRDVVRRGETTRTIRNLPIGADCSWVVVTLPRVQCRNCGLMRQIKIGFTEELECPENLVQGYESTGCETNSAVCCWSEGAARSAAVHCDANFDRGGHEGCCSASGDCNMNATGRSR